MATHTSRPPDSPLTTLRSAVQADWWVAGVVCMWMLLGGSEWLLAQGGSPLVGATLALLGIVVSWGITEDILAVADTNL
ncbi:hypothetical protein RYH80_17900 [Halobaculum sp. MBLA0147]|uniref:hypothetical protein n=1 Tax=Halobaculum sp. MBLA0147 TaxID=3079934 RepID=UPI003523355A